DCFMAGDARKLQSRPKTVFDNRITVADATSLHFDSHPARVWMRNLTFDNFKISPRPGDLCSTHLCHKKNISYPEKSELNLPHLRELATRTCSHKRQGHEKSVCDFYSFAPCAPGDFSCHAPNGNTSARAAIAFH